MSAESDHLKPSLEHAQADLIDRLAEACDQDVAQESTGELIRLEEVLTSAADAAKEAISIRRRLGADRKRRETGPAGGTPEGTDPSGTGRPGEGTDPSGTGRPDEGVRDFVDEGGRKWHVWEVSAEQLRSSKRARAYTGAFANGWLAFQADDGAERRRLPDYPDDWRTTPNAELEALCRAAQPVTRRDKAPGASG